VKLQRSTRRWRWRCGHRCDDLCARVDARAALCDCARAWQAAKDPNGVCNAAAVVIASTDRERSRARGAQDIRTW
jgi:hypothetical protein